MPEEEDAQQTAISYRGDAEAGLYDVALASVLDGVDGDGEEDEGPEDGGEAGDEGIAAAVRGSLRWFDPMSQSRDMGHPLLLPRAEGNVEVDDRGGGERVEGSGEIGHGGGKDGSDEQAGDAVGHLLDDEGGEESVGGDGVGPLSQVVLVDAADAVEDEEADADEEKEEELEEDDHARAEQGKAGFAQVAGGEHALDHELICPVAGHGEEGSAEDAGPEGVGVGE